MFLRNCLRMRRFQFFCTRKSDLGPSWAAGVIQDRENERNASNGRVECIIDTRPGRQNGNPG